MNPAESTGPSRAFLDTYLQALRAFAPPGLARALPEALAARPDRASAALADLQARQLALWRRWFIDGTAVEPTAPESDPRFRDAAWREEPYFRLLHAQYRVWSDWAQAVPRTLGLEGHAARRVAFGLRQWIEASAPTLMLPWNPAALRTAIETGGRSLEQGLMNLRSDLAAGRIAMSAPDAFVVGRDLAVTAGDIVFENALIQVIQYRPTTGRVYRRPLVIVPPFINKFYILDLRPENSFVRWAVAQGHQVFLISWRNIGPAQATLDWTDYVRLGVFAALDVALDVADSPDANVLGFCVGGTLSATAAAVEATRNSARIASLTLLATLSIFRTRATSRCTSTNPASTRPSASGPAASCPAVDWRTRSPVRGHASRLALRRAQLPAGQDATGVRSAAKLNGDGAKPAGPAVHVWYLRNLYLENRLTQANALRVDDVPLDLRRVQVPLYASPPATITSSPGVRPTPAPHCRRPAPFRTR
ncbi:MAG: alpha/beta fold hydrolase [Burkholderiales bacterium]|nr:alpha/beta fold hydrolase [Burkholderiales bacterium]